MVHFLHDHASGQCKRFVNVCTVHFEINQTMVYFPKLDTTNSSSLGKPHDVLCPLKRSDQTNRSGCAAWLSYPQIP